MEIASDGDAEADAGLDLVAARDGEGEHNDPAEKQDTLDEKRKKAKCALHLSSKILCNRRRMSLAHMI